MTWRVGILTSSIPTDRDDTAVVDDNDAPPADMWDGVEPPIKDPGQVWIVADHAVATEPDKVAPALDSLGDDVEADLALAGLIRAYPPTPLEPTDAEVTQMIQRAALWNTSPVTRERMLEINNLALAFFEDQLTHSWGRAYLADRFGQDLAGHPGFRPGQAPAGWTRLVDHLRGYGITDQEMITVGVATTARTGRLIDRFRDRVAFPITHQGEVLGFIGRRHPDLTDEDRAGPKYLNTPDTPLFHKGAQLFGILDDDLAAGAIPVTVEGPMDAIAVTLATAGSHLGVATLGTSLTNEQAKELALIGRDPIVATDADLAGQVAAERDFWILTSHGLNPNYARFPAGTDPADLLTNHGPAALAGRLTLAGPLANVLLDERLANLPPGRARGEATRILAATTSEVWNPGTKQLSHALGVPAEELRRDLRDAVRTWETDPRRAAQVSLEAISTIAARLTAAIAAPPEQRWAAIAHQIDDRLPTQPDWPALATIIQQAHQHGVDVPAALEGLVRDTPLAELPAQDLRYRLVAITGLEPGAAWPIEATSPRGAPPEEHRQPERPRPTPPRRR